ncbi:MAG: NAD(P)-dependent alcohol dehydrogenase [Steroidobacteraceae bacterium]
MTTLRRKLALWVGASVLLVLAASAVILSHDAPCKAPPALVPGVIPMKAVVRRCYGPPEVLKLEEIARPVPRDNQLLVKIHAASVNPADWHMVRAEPYIIRLDTGVGAPRNPRVGIDFAGTVEAIGKDVTRYKVGEAVFGGRNGALAEYLVINEDGNLATISSSISFEQAAGINVAGLTALQALRDRASVKRGQKVLINGASGGVGTFAVQIAKWLGAEVTAVCSTRNMDLVRSLGADHVIDYTRSDFTRSAERYDLLLDNVANRGVLEMRGILKPQGKLLIVGGGGPDANPWGGALWAPIKAFVIAWFVDQDVTFFLSHSSSEDLATLARLMEKGTIRTVVDRRYPVAETSEAMRYLETGRARGKVIVTIDPGSVSK